MTRSPQPRVEINLEEIYQILDSARRQPMSEAEYEKVKTAVAALAEKAAPRSRTTERTDAVLPNQNKPAEKEPAKPAKSGHGRNGAARFTGAKRVIVAHATLQSGTRHHWHDRKGLGRCCGAGSAVGLYSDVRPYFNR